MSERGEGLKRFFEELPMACIAYSCAIGAAGLAVIVVRLAYHVLVEMH